MSDETGVAKDHCVLISRVAHVGERIGLAMSGAAPVVSFTISSIFRPATVSPCALI
jgi:hypothetical protein